MLRTRMISWALVAMERPSLFTTRSLCGKYVEMISLQETNIFPYKSHNGKRKIVENHFQQCRLGGEMLVNWKVFFLSWTPHD